ncbi:histamine N-methyltransferase-like [Hippocampus zosterae]|uniref:histamine N-methyltransferase-like n=1 Tax=Hippocampus zosterae TaxID=109293 RepID=UPI00223CDD40|nr:histamine N-methyltransferase-like [Hippocampus zosterae]
MASPLRSLVYDDNRYNKAFHLFLQRSSEHQCMKDFIHNVLPDVLASIGNGKPHLNVIGVGSGDGRIDLEMFSELHQKHPEAMVDYEVVEPSSQQLHCYKVLLSQKSDLDYIIFKWNKMTAIEFEEQWKLKEITKKIDFIHMIQMLYYVNNVEATITFFRSLLAPNGKLLIILVSDESGWGKLKQTFRGQICACEIAQCTTTTDVKSILDAGGVQYKSYMLPSQMDITECFTEGDESGDLLLDFLTEVDHFSQTASPQLKADVLKLLRDPACSREADGKVVFNNNLEVVVVDSPR